MCSRTQSLMVYLSSTTTPTPTQVTLAMLCTTSLTTTMNLCTMRPWNTHHLWLITQEQLTSWCPELTSSPPQISSPSPVPSPACLPILATLRCAALEELAKNAPLLPKECSGC